VAEIFVRRIKNIILNSERHLEVNSDNFPVRDKLILFRGTHILIRADIVIGEQNEPQTPFTPDDNSEWEFRVDTVFGTGQEDLIVSLNDQFNIAADRDDLNIGQGKISFRVDTTSTQLQTLLGVLESVTASAELWMIPPSENPVLVCQFNITLKNIATEIGTSSTLVFSTTNLIRADGDDTVILLPDGTIADRWSP